MDKHQKTISLLEAFLSDKVVDGICGYMVVPDDGEDSIQVIVVLDIDYINQANTKPGFVAKMIRNGVKQEIQKWLGIDVYVGSTAKKCDSVNPISESMSTHVKRRLTDNEVMDELNTIIMFEVDSLSYKPLEYVEEVCDLLNEKLLDHIWETTNLKVSLKEKDELYFYFFDKYKNYILKKYYSYKDITESKKPTKYIITENQSNFLLHDILDEMFEGYTIKFVETGEMLIYVGDKLMMVKEPGRAVFSKDILDKVQNILFYDTMKDFKDSVREWLLKNFHVKSGNETLFGINFKNFDDDVKIVKHRKNKVK